MMDDELTRALQGCFERHAIPSSQQERLLKWAGDICTASALLENVRHGHVDVVKWAKGQAHFSITDAGKKYVVENMLPSPSGDVKADK